MTQLAQKKCVPCEGGTTPLSEDKSRELLRDLSDEWKLQKDGKQIQATFTFKNYFRTLAFVNAAAYIAIQEDHHPDITFTFNTCTVMFWTHNINGLSENDFICAAKLDALRA